jgi:uncharacterized damage-inducible protein DinB
LRDLSSREGYLPNAAASQEGLDFLWAQVIVGVQAFRFADFVYRGISMADLRSTISSDFAGYYQYVAAQVHRWVDPLTQEQFWHNPFGYGNSAGHLILHLTGNLNYYIGARIAETGYIRDRDREFTETENPDKAKVMHAFDQSIAMVVTTIQKQRSEDWMAAYSAEREPEAEERFMIFLRCAGHAYHHVGQLIYLSKELKREAKLGSASA